MKKGSAVAVFLTMEKLLKHQEIQGKSAAGSAPLEGNYIDVQSAIQPRLLFSTHPPFFSPLQPIFTSLPRCLPSSRCFCQTQCKTVSKQLFGKQQLEKNRDFSGEGAHRRLEYFPAGATSKTVLITLDNAFLEQK